MGYGSWVDHDVRHHAAIVFLVIAQLVQPGGIDEIGARFRVRGVEDDIGRLPAAQRDGSGLIEQALAVRPSQQSRILGHHRHGDARHRQGVELGLGDVGNAEQYSLALSWR